MNKIIESHKNKYPLMQVDDYIKLLFQNEFGPEHLVTNKDKVVEYIKSELDNDSESEHYYIESIGNSLCRFHFNKLNNNEIDVLADLFIKTSECHKGNKDIFINKLNGLEDLNKDWKEKINKYINEGINPIHHSNLFRNTYKPHYRVIKYEYGVYFELICKINELIKNNNQLIIAIDGRCGSGKSRLAELLESIYDCNLIHIDDYFIPMNERVDNWKDKIAGNINFDRLENEVLRNLKTNDSYIEIKYNCQKNEYSENLKVHNKKLTIIEGSYSLHDTIDHYYDYKVFLTCDSNTQKERIIERNKEYYVMFESTWIPMEEKYFKEMSIINKADILIDNSDMFKDM